MTTSTSAAPETSSTPSSSRTATPQHASTAATSEMGPPAVPRRSTQDDMDVDPSADRQSPSTSRGTPAVPAPPADRRNSTNAAPPPPPARATASPPVAIKPDPDAHAPARRPSVLDRLAPIRAARGVPAEFVARASEKVATINAAWDRIKRERGL